MIQNHMHEIPETQHIMQMIDTDIRWYEQTFREILMELRKIRNGETPTKTSEESNKTAMMCWKSLDDSEQASKKQKMHAQDDEMNDKANDMDDKMPTMSKCTTNMVKHLNIPVGELRLGADDDMSTLATQETSAKHLVYITNMPEGTLETVKNVQDPKKAKEHKKNTWRMRKIIHMEFKSDDDVDEQAKNSSDAKAEGKVQVRKKIVHYYEISSDKEEGKRADPQKLRKPKMATKINKK